MASPSFLDSGTGTPCSHRPVIKHPSFVLGFRPLSISILSVSKPSACRWHLTPEYLRWGCVSKFHTSETLQLEPASALWGRVVLRNSQCWLAPENVPVVGQWQRFKDYGKSQHTQPVPGFIALRCLCCNSDKCGCSLDSTGTFASGDAI